MTITNQNQQHQKQPLAVNKYITEEQEKVDNSLEQPYKL